MTRALAPVLAFLCACDAWETTSASLPLVTFVTDSAGRTLINGVAEILLQCGSSEALSLYAEEQCAMIAADDASLHSVFRYRQVLTSSATLAIVTVDDAAGAASAVQQLSAGNAAFVHVVLTAPAGTSPASTLFFMDGTAAAVHYLHPGDGVTVLRLREQLLGAVMALSSAPAPRAMLPGNASVSSGKMAVTVQSPPPWQWWLNVKPFSRVLGSLVVVLASVGLLLLNQSTLSDSIVSGVGGHAPNSGSGGSDKAGLHGPSANGSAAVSSTQAASANASGSDTNAKSDRAERGDMTVPTSSGSPSASSSSSNALSPSSSSSMTESGSADSGAMDTLIFSPNKSPLASSSNAGALSSSSSAAAVAALGEPETDAQRDAKRRALMHRVIWTAIPLLVIVMANVVLDRWKAFPLLDKIRDIPGSSLAGTDMFWAMGLLALILVCFFTLQAIEKDADSLMCIKQTEEIKGWMMFLFLVYHYWDVKSVYNIIRVLVSSYVFFTGFGNTISLASKPPTLLKFASSYLRINFLVTIIALPMGTPWMLYYICALHTLWTGVVYAINIPGPISKPWRYVILTAAITLIWHVPSLFYTLFYPVRPLVLLDNSMYEWFFRSKLDMYSALIGCIVAELRPTVMAHLKANDSGPMAIVRVVSIVSVMVVHYNALLSLADRKLYNWYHPYTSWVPIVGFILLRNNTSGLRKTHSHHLVLIGRHSLELYLLQFHVWLGNSAKTNVVLIPELRAISTVVMSIVFVVLAVVSFRATSSAVLLLSAGRGVAVVAMIVSVLLLCVAPLLTTG